MNWGQHELASGLPDLTPDFSKVQSQDVTPDFCRLFDPRLLQTFEDLTPDFCCPPVAPDFLGGICPFAPTRRGLFGEGVAAEGKGSIDGPRGTSLMIDDANRKRVLENPSS
jgi:hypothetical protein